MLLTWLCCLAIDLALPPLGLVATLPETDDLRVLGNLNAVYSGELAAFIEDFGPYPQALSAQQETAQLGALYWQMWKVRTGLTPAHARLLRRLSDLERRVLLWHILRAAGADAPRTGVWPPPVPWWRFVCVP